MRTLYLATHNPNKIRELSQIFHAAKLAIKVAGPEAFGRAEQVPETGNTFIENASLKAKALFTQLKNNPEMLSHALGVLADDSGICVDALNGEPGVHSAYYAGPQATSLENNTKLLAALKNIPYEQRTAHYICTLVFIDTFGNKHAFTGKLEGHITHDSHGSNGFGYDPLMIPTGYTQTCAQLPPEEKNKISHRSQALKQLIKYLQDHPLR